MKMERGFYCETHGLVPAEQVDKAALIHVSNADGLCGKNVTPKGGAAVSTDAARRIAELTAANEKLKTKIAALEAKLNRPTATTAEDDAPDDDGQDDDAPKPAKRGRKPSKNG